MRLPDPARSRVVLLGSSAYADDRLPDLPAVAANLGDLTRELTDPGLGLVPAEHCSVLLDQGDLRLLGRELRAAARAAEDVLLVYFAGHGLVGGERHDLYLALPDSDFEEPEFNSLEYDKLRAAVRASPAAVKIIVLDCCFSGRVVTDTMADEAGSLLSRLDVAGTYVLTSAARDQVALVRPGERHSAFTGRLLRLLREGIVGGPELLTIDTVYEHLLTVMTAEGLSYPQKRGTRTADRIAISHNRAYGDTVRVRAGERSSAAIARAFDEGDWASAVPVLQQVAEELARVVGASDPDTLTVRQHLAHGIGALGRPDEAVALLREVLAEQVRRLDRDDPAVLRSRQFLGVNLGESGARSEAVAVLRVLAADRRRVLGAGADETLRTTHQLARNLALLGEAEESAALLREVVAARTTTVGENDPRTVRARDDLAHITAGRRGTEGAR